MSRTIATNVSGGLTLTNTADSPIYIAQGVTIDNASGPALIDGAAFYWSVTNGASAQVTGTSFGVSLSGAATVVSQGAVTASYASGHGFTYDSTTHVVGILSAGVYVGGGGVSNAQTGVISGVLGVALGGLGSVVNAGLIEDTVAGKGSAIILAAGGSVTNLTGGTISSTNYGILTDGVATISNLPGATITGASRGIYMVNGSATVTNQGTIAGGTVAGVLMAAGGSVTNQANGSIYGGEAGVLVETANGTVTNQGVIVQQGVYSSPSGAIGGVLLLAGGTVDNQGGTITGTSYGIDVASVAGTVVNTGSVASSVTAGGAGVILVAGGTLDNSGTITSQGYGALLANAAGTVTNSGMIASYVTGGGAGVALLRGGAVTNSANGVITGEFIGVQFGSLPTSLASVEAPAGTFLNQGIVSASDGQGNGAAVWLHGPGVVINSAYGTIEGGVNGTIIGGPLAGLSSGPFGIVAYYQTTVINYGFIGGGIYNSTLYNSGTLGPKQFAFEAASKVAGNTIANLIEMAPGALFAGVVKGTDGNASATLELLSGSSAGTVSSFGTVTNNGTYYRGYLGFGAVKIDNGARWSLGGTVAAGTLVEFAPAGTATLTFAEPALMQGTITGFDKGDTIGLAGISVTGSSYAGGVLTLTEAVGGPINLNLAGNFTTGAFTVTNTAGTAEITVLQSQNRTLDWTGGAGSGFATAANWNDTANGLNPAQTAPGATDTVRFDTAGGAVTGNGTVATVEVGSTGSGTLQLGGGAALVTGSLDVGVAPAAIGEVDLTGSGTELTVTGSATVADGGTGVMSVLSGATLAAATLTIGSLSGSSGTLTVSGAGSVIDVTGALNIGTALDTGELTIGAGAAVHAAVVNLLGEAVLQGGLLDPTVQLIGQSQTVSGYGTIESGFIIDEGIIQAGGSQSLLVVEGTVVGGGTLTVDGVAAGSNAAGILQINAAGTLELTGAVLNTASTTFTDGLTPAGTYSVTNSAVDVTFVDGTGVLLLDDIADFGGTITTYQGGDEFVITGGTLSGLAVSNGNTLTISDSAGSGRTDQIVFGGTINPAWFSIINSNTVQVACFAAGTAIRMDHGTLPVEQLRPGMHVETWHGDLAKIVWIGQRHIDCRQHPAPVTVCPVRVLAGAFGPGRPSRDLWLSPDHAVFVDDVLIPVHYLINGGTIRQMLVPEVTYYHVELAEHDVILAEDLAVESYLDTGNRANFANPSSPVRLFPDFSARMWEMAGCAPLITTGPTLERVRQELARINIVGVELPLGSSPRALSLRLNNRYTYY